MTARLPVGGWALAALLIGLATPPSLTAQGRESAAEAPDVQTMIDRLRPDGESRSRNLLVRERPSAAQAASGVQTPPVAAAPFPAASASPAPAAAPLPPTTAGAAPAASAQGFGTQPAQEPASLSLAIQFEPNSAQVLPASGPVLARLVAALQSAELRGSRFAIEGHTDASGSAARNQVLSQQRADEVRLFLVALGVHPSRLQAVGKGSSEPANPAAPRAAENRRVRVVALP